MDPKTKNDVSQFSKTELHVGFENYQKSEKRNIIHTFKCSVEKFGNKLINNDVNHTSTLLSRQWTFYFSDQSSIRTHINQHANAPN